jgi:hypothetical protein
VRMQYQREWRAALLGVVVATLKAAIRPGEHHFRHDTSKSIPWCSTAAERPGKRHACGERLFAVQNSLPGGDQRARTPLAWVDAATLPVIRTSRRSARRILEVIAPGRLQRGTRLARQRRLLDAALALPLPNPSRTVVLFFPTDGTRRNSVGRRQVSHAPAATRSIGRRVELSYWKVKRGSSFCGVNRRFAARTLTNVTPC